MEKVIEYLKREKDSEQVQKVKRQVVVSNYVPPQGSMNHYENYGWCQPPEESKVKQAIFRQVNFH